MRQAAPLLSVPPNLYKHFAVVTVAITACVAMFADGESRSKTEHEVVQREPRKAALTAEAGKVGNRRMVEGMRDNRASQGGADVIDAPPPPAEPSPGGFFSSQEPTTPWARSGAMTSPIAAPRPRPKKLPPVLPPGAPGQAGLPGAPAAPITAQVAAPESLP